MFKVPLMRLLASESQRGCLRLISGVKFACIFKVNDVVQSCVYSKQHCNGFSKEFSTRGSKTVKLRLKKPPSTVLLCELERSLKEHQVNEAWETYKVFKNTYGYPGHCVLNDLISELSYSPDSKDLRRACNLVISISREKSGLLSPEIMMKMALSLARAQIPVSAASVLRLALEKRRLPSPDALRMIFLHLVKTETGAYLASNILEEIFYFFDKWNVDKLGLTGLAKPDTVIFNVVLDACVSFGSPLKGLLVMELMAREGVVADAHTAAIIARIHEMNGMRYELMKFNEIADMAPRTLVRYYQQFYDSLLSLHFEFNDIDSASALLHELCPCDRSQNEEMKPCTISIGSDNIKKGLKLQFLPYQLQRDYVYRVEGKKELIIYEDGKLLLSKKALAKLIIGYKKSGRINELSRFLISIRHTLSSPENTDPCSDVIDACIYLGWLETAHDIIEDLESEKCRVSERSYTSLLASYYDRKMFREAEGLVIRIKKAHPAMDFSDGNRTLDTKERTIYTSDLANSIVMNMKKDGTADTSLVHEYNASIYFFAKAKMMEDAKQAYQKLRKTKIVPSASTFFHLICGYSSLEMYREITFLWGDIKRTIQNHNAVYNRDLYELLLLNLLRGGYFERVMEVIGFMRERNMFLDKGSYGTEFLKFHRNLYRKLTACDAKDEVQRKRMEYVGAFRKFIGIG